MTYENVLLQQHNQEIPRGNSDLPKKKTFRSSYKTKRFCFLSCYNYSTNGGSYTVCLQSLHANPLWRRLVAFFFLLRSFTGWFKPVREIRFRSVGSWIVFQYGIVKDHNHDHYACCFHWSPVTRSSSGRDMMRTRSQGNLKMRVTERVRDFVITTWLGLVSDIFMSAWNGRINLM